MQLAAALLLLLATGPAPNTEDCLTCHGEKSAESDAGRSLFVDADRFRASSHGGFECADCHTGIRALPHGERLSQVSCGSCHEDTEKEYAKSVHGRAAAAGVGDAATCRSCHGPAHEILGASNPASKVAKHNLADTCGSCHADPDFLARHKIPFAKPVEAYRLSVHGRAVARGEIKAASCSDCHGSHGILPGRDPESKINHWHVAETCGACHGEIRTTFLKSIHGMAASRGLNDAPVCTSCHGEHTILAPSEPNSLVNPVRVSSVTCGRCHADERLAARYNLPTDNVPTFENSYHGLAARAGSQTVANCASCHGVHNILPSSDPSSTIHPANLARTCGSCHPGAGQRFTIGAVHVRADSAAEHWSVRFIRLSYLILIPATLGFMLLHNGADFLTKLVRGSHIQRTGEQVPRMNLQFRIAHFLVVASFLTLVVTGFALKFPDSFWFAPLLAFEGRIPFRGLVHRIAGLVLIGAFVYHLVHLAVVRRDRVILREMLPRMQDAFDIVAMFRHFLKRDAPRPGFGMFGYAEKMEYWAFVWGTMVMAVSGFVLWFENWTLSHFPKWVSDAATAVHWYEAILATASILIWHWYMVIFDPDVYPMDTAWLTGKASADHVRHTRPAYYLSLIASLARARERKVEATPSEAKPAPGEPDQGDSESGSDL